MRRTGQALEVAVYRSILASQNAVVPIGGFHDLEAHDDSQLYSKEESRVLNGRSLGKRSLDFILLANGEFCGVEVKNVRPWLYPHEREVKDAIAKALTLNAIPVLIARRIPFVTFKVLGTCGVLFHQTLRQRMANADGDLAERVRHKNSLGYHDIVVGNEPDEPLLRFMKVNLPALVGPARDRLDVFSDLLWAFATGDMPYVEFAARVRRRETGENEDGDNERDETPDDPYDLFDR